MMSKVRHWPASRPDSPLQGAFALAFGILLGLSLLKFGNPVIMDSEVLWPTNIYEWLLTAWPLAMGHGLLAGVIILGVSVVRRRPGLPLVWMLAPLPWLAWQLVAATGSVDPQRTLPTVIHFTTNLAAFYLGLFALSPIRHLRWFWAALMTGFLLVLLSGWQQHFGGLEATRQLFLTEIYPSTNGDLPPELLKRMSSDRIFATLFYPNTLAGVVLLLAPVSIGVLPRVLGQGSVQRMGLLLTLILAGGCLVWSGSKAGWLLMLGLMLIALFRLSISPKIKVGVAIAVFCLGATGFLWKYSDYLQKGAQSAMARIDYWQAALTVTGQHPVRGTGPGTFGVSYAAVKQPESEMAHLTHNDYLQQACDSGLPGFVFFTAFIVGTMILVGVRSWRASDPMLFWVWLGLLGISAQSMTEFGLYIPAVSWTTMALLGWMVGTTTNHLDNRESPNIISRRT
jgi:O-antigen ligase